MKICMLSGHGKGMFINVMHGGACETRLSAPALWALVRQRLGRLFWLSAVTKQNSAGAQDKLCYIFVSWSQSASFFFFFFCSKILCLQLSWKEWSKKDIFAACFCLEFKWLFKGLRMLKSCDYFQQFQSRIHVNTTAAMPYVVCLLFPQCLVHCPMYFVKVLSRYAVF